MAYMNCAWDKWIQLNLNVLLTIYKYHVSQTCRIIISLYINLHHKFSCHSVKKKCIAKPCSPQKNNAGLSGYISTSLSCEHKSGPRTVSSYVKNRLLTMLRSWYRSIWTEHTGFWVWLSLNSVYMVCFRAHNDKPCCVMHCHK